MDETRIFGVQDLLPRCTFCHNATLESKYRPKINLEKFRYSKVMFFSQVDIYEKKTTELEAKLTRNERKGLALPNPGRARRCTNKHGEAKKLKSIIIV